MSFVVKSSSMSSDPSLFSQIIFYIVQKNKNLNLYRKLPSMRNDFLGRTGILSLQYWCLFYLVVLQS